MGKYIYTKKSFFSVFLVLVILGLGAVLHYGLASADTGYTVSGNLSFGASSSPAANVTLELTNVSTNAVEETTTDSSGNYSLPNTPNGTYTALFTDYMKGNGNPIPTTFGAWPLSGSITVNNADVTQNFSYNTNSVTVTVRDASGNLASGAVVTLSNDNSQTPFTDKSGNFSFKSYSGNIVSSVTTDGSGTATVAVVPGLTYTVCATLSGGGQSCGSNLTVSSDTTDEIDFPITHNVSGTVSFGSSSNPASNVYVQLTNESTGAQEQTTTDGSGNYSFPNTPDGDYTAYLIYYNKGNGNPVPTSFSAFPLSGSVVLSGSNLTQNFNFNTNLVTVTVRDPSGALASGATVTLANVDPSGTFNDSSNTFTFKTYGGNTASTATTDGSGTATVAVVPGLTYTVCATLSGGGQSCGSNLTVSSDTTDEIDFPPSAPSGLTIPSPTATPSLTWSAVSGASSYNIYRDGTMIDNSSSVSYTDNTASVGSHNYYVTAVNSAGESGDSNSVNVTVGTAPAITSTSSSSSGMRVPFSFTVTTTGSPVPTLSETGSLPSGISFHDNGDGTATLSGIAAAGTNGSYPITITADNGVGSSAMQSFTLTITTATSAAAITSANSYTATYGAPASFTVTTTGYPVPTITKSGSVASGMTFTDNGDGTATISGTPAGTAEGVYSITLRAHNGIGVTATQSFTLTVNRAPSLPTIGTKTSTVGTAYTLSIASTAYPEATMSASGLPSGLSFTDNGDGTGTINGTPSVGSGGAYTVTITATNSLGTTNQSFTLKVNEGPTITSAGSASATIGTPFSFPVTSTGYPTPTVTKTGTLPAGITFNGATDTFSGTAHAGTAGSYPITLTATNSTGTVTQNFVLTVH
jgi:hypothetical protein